MNQLKKTKKYTKTHEASIFIGYASPKQLVLDIGIGYI